MCAGARLFCVNVNFNVNFNCNCNCNCNCGAAVPRVGSVRVGWRDTP